jgi:hypothetical protein
VPLADEYGHLMVVSDIEMFKINENINQKTCQFKKIRSAEIVEYMEKGVHCSFDEESYKRFYPTAQSIFVSPKSPEYFDEFEVEGDEAIFCSLGFAPK